jgi:ParB family chromosome partitioning protein
MSDAIPQGIPRILNIDDIKWDTRYRAEFGDLEAMADSIREKGIIQPISVSTKMKLLAGERRIRAAKMAGLTKIPALVREVTGEVDEREIELLENIYREDFTWAEKVKGIRDIDRLYREKHMDWSGRKTAELLNKGIGSVSRYLQLASAIDSFPELAEVATAEEALKVVKKIQEKEIVSELRKRHDVDTPGFSKGLKAMLKIGENNYNIGDTFKGLSELRTNGVVNVIECDPPYGIDLKVMKRAKDSATATIHKYNEIDIDEYPQFLHTLTKELYRVAAQHSWLIFWFGPTWQHQVLTSLRAAGWSVDEIPCIWVKSQGQTMQPEVYLGRAYEPFYLCRKGIPTLIKRGRLNVFDFATTPGQQKIHTTERPLPLMEELLETVGLPGQVVLVPFLGSGNTLRAAYKCGMKAFGWEKSSEYKDQFMLAIEADSRALGADENE